MSTSRNAAQDDTELIADSGSGLRILARMIARVYAARRSASGAGGDTRGVTQIDLHDRGEGDETVRGGVNEDVS